jgi:hypothetical protein
MGNYPSVSNEARLPDASSDTEETTLYRRFVQGATSSGSNNPSRSINEPEDQMLSEDGIAQVFWDIENCQVPKGTV